MTYHEKDIDKLEVMPQKMSSRKAAGRQWDYYRESWSRAHGYVDKVSRESLVGKHLGELTKKYLHRLHPEYRTIGGLLKALSIEWECELLGRHNYSHYYRYHCLYYIDAETNKVVMLPPKYRRRKEKSTYNERMRLYYEKLRATNKKLRERRIADRQYRTAMVDWLYWKRKRDAEALSRQKLISHGFDPDLSFRKHKTLSRKLGVIFFLPIPFHYKASLLVYILKLRSKAQTNQLLSIVQQLMLSFTRSTLVVWLLASEETLSRQVT